MNVDRLRNTLVFTYLTWGEDLALKFCIVNVPELMTRNVPEPELGFGAVAQIFQAETKPWLRLGARVVLTWTKSFLQAHTGHYY